MSYDSTTDGAGFNEEECHEDLWEKIPSMKITKLNFRQKEGDETLDEHVKTFIGSFRKPIKELDISGPIKETFDTLPGSFNIKILTYTKILRSEIAKYFEKLSGKISVEKQRISYMILLFREIRPHSDPTCPVIEMYTLTSGIAHTLLNESECDEEFPKQIARRVLEFNLKSLSSKHLIGTHMSSSATYRPDEGKELSFWDYLGHITTNYVVPFKTNCSLFRIGCFQTKKGKPRNVSMTIGINYLKVNMKLNLIDFGYIIQQLSRISRRRVFQRFGSTENEVDDNSFDILGHVELVRNKNLVEKLDVQLKKDIIVSINNGKPLKLSLVHRKLEAWNCANRFFLLIRENPKSRRKCLKTWEGVPPCFSDIVEEVKKVCQGMALQEDTLDKLYLKFENTAAESSGESTLDSLSQFVERHVRTKEGKSFFRYCGKWLKIRTAYLAQLEKEFTNIKRSCQLEQEIIPLPWIYSGKNAGKHIKKDKTERMRPTTVMDQKIFEKWLSKFKLNDPGNFQTALQVDFDNYTKSDTEPFDCAKEIFYRMHCHQTEGMYNEGFLWYDHLVTPEEGYLLSDRILVKNVELFDILHFTPKKTYLIHVKEGLAETTRDVCSQIRVSADLLFKNIICNNNFDFLEELWNSVTRGEKKGYTLAVKHRYERLGKDNFLDLFKRDELVFVLAYRDQKEDRNAAEFDNYPGDRLRAAFGEKFNDVEKELKRTGYLKDFAGKTRLTNKIYYTQEQAKQEIQLSPIADRLKAFNILQEAMSLHKSFIAKIEIVHLYNHFKQLRTASQSMCLKLCRIQTELNV